jgi:hypothetical protein
MNTEQNYVGRGNYATQPTPAAQNEASSLQTLDNRQNATPPLGVDPDVYRVQTQLLDLVDDFLSTGNASEPVEAVNDLLYRWLTTSAIDLSLDANRKQLYVAQQLVNFLTALYEQNENLHLFTNLTKEKGGQQL